MTKEPNDFRKPVGRRVTKGFLWNFCPSGCILCIAFPDIPWDAHLIKSWVSKRSLSP